MFTWKRTNFEGFPKVYMRFHARDTDSDDLVEYRIQDLPEERFSEAVEFMLHDQYLREEPFAKGTEVKDNPEALEEYRELFKAFVNEKTSIVCFKDGCDDIVAVNVLFGLDTTVDALDLPFKSDVLKRILACGKYVISQSTPFEPHDDQYVLEGFGLSVDKKYRKRGIAVKMLEARFEVMKHVGLRTTSTIFSAFGSQTAAKRAGYTEYYSISFDDLAKQGHHFKHLTEKCVKTLGYQIKS